MTRKVVDWEAVELQYRAGIRSLKDIGSEFDVSDAAIIKRAKRDGWSRDLKAKIQAKADAKVSAAAVSAEVSARTKVAERQVVEANAQVLFDVQMAHRAGLRRLAELRDKQLGELEALPMPAADGEKAPEPLPLPVRISALKTLSEIDERLRRGQREAYGIDKIVPDEGGIVSTLTDAERASRAAAILQLAMQRRQAETPGAA
ncbi:hypothetical protein EJP67_16545 [Variovorax guangxiensis]|uniref:Terminase n=1 Tax=Variovorax guangxiensis TaxID=1775474 RepID=A0A3S0XSX1_9BURK|nr:hypothetical protein [Variovorax guangxiensis]RUR68672.1 hypothetical protein EJP67_16545 [Variovorax guangxiensis]